MFTLPYAGGSASIYHDWIARLQPEIEVCPIEYAGHAGRFTDDFYGSIEEAAEDVSEMILQKKHGDYILYGHSMGCLVALETAFILEKKQAQMPKAIILAASRPPHLLGQGVQLGDLSKEELMKVIIAKGQFEEEVLACEELLELISDIMYADIQIFSKYRRTFENGKISVPILAYAGREDEEMTEEDMQAWQNYTTGEFISSGFEGNHFFAFNNNEKFLAALREDLKRIGTLEVSSKDE